MRFSAAIATALCQQGVLSADQRALHLRQLVGPKRIMPAHTEFYGKQDAEGGR
jgi:hypothetical protein